MTQQPLDRALAEAGQKRIAWAKHLMPVLTEAANALKSTGVLEHQHIGVCLPIDSKVANLAFTLSECGARISCWTLGYYADSEIIHALREKDIPVYSAEDENVGEEWDNARALLTTKPDILLDNGADIISLARTEFPELFSQLKGVTESSKTGMEKLGALSETQPLNIPVINLNDTRLNQLLNNTIGCGQSVVMAMLDLTNLQIAGRNILVIGYGSVGKGIAMHAAALGARVTVADVDPVIAMQAQYDGFLAKSISDAAPIAEVVFSATGAAQTLTAEHLEKMPDGVILCAAGCGQPELPMKHFEKAEDKKSVRARVSNYQFSNGKNLLLLADGHCVNATAAEGSPIEIADMTMALQLASIEFLLSDDAKDKSRVELMLRTSEEKIALTHLELTGGTIEQ